jgi:hypothetical protein
MIITSCQPHGHYCLVERDITFEPNTGSLLRLELFLVVSQKSHVGTSRYTLCIMWLFNSSLGFNV